MEIRTEGTLLQGRKGKDRNAKTKSSKEQLDMEEKKHAYDEIIDTMVQNDRVNLDDKGFEGVRLAVKKMMSHSSQFGQMYDWIMIGISVASCLQYIYCTYIVNIDRLRMLDKVEMVWSGVFIFDILLNVWLEDHKLEHFQKISVILGILSVIPIWITYDRHLKDPVSAKSSEDSIIYIIFAISTTRILRPWRIQQMIKELTNEVQRCVGEMALTIILMILFSKYYFEFG